MIDVIILRDSINPAGVRLITWKLTYPRIIHSEFMTHRVFSRNAASSRAIPTVKWLAAVRGTPAMPVEWGVNQKGMSASEQLSAEEVAAAEAWWLEGRDLMAAHVEKGLRLFGAKTIHKQIINRPLETWQHMTVIASATDYKGFFAQRAHPAAQPEFQALARAMKALYESSTPQRLEQRQWHLPLVYDDEFRYTGGQDRYGAWEHEGTCTLEQAQKMSAARCAAVSYLRQEDERTLEEWLAVFNDKLVGGDVFHLSPLEHQAMAAGHRAYLSNFRGFHQLRASYDPYRED